MQPTPSNCCPRRLRRCDEKDGFEEKVFQGGCAVPKSWGLECFQSVIEGPFGKFSLSGQRKMELSFGERSLSAKLISKASLKGKESECV